MKEISRRHRWERPEPQRTGPIRGIGGYYRSADREVDGRLFRGVPLNTAEDAALAAVRMAYRIADSQIDRGLRIARDLRGAAAREGIEPRDAVDASERLLSKALLASLQWFESASNDGGHPLRRLAAAEYRMLGSLFGLAADREPADRAESQAAPAVRAAPPVGPPATVAPEKEVEVFNYAGRDARRPVLAATLSLASGSRDGRDDELRFHHVDANGDDGAISGRIAWDAKSAARLEVDASMKHRPGRWIAGIYGDEGRQIAVVAIEL